MSSTTESGRAAGFASLAVAVMTVSTSALFVRAAQEGAPSLAIAAWRTVLAASIVAAVVLPRRWREVRGATGADAAAVTLSGVCLGVHFACWIGSLAWTSVAVSVVLVNTAPLFVAAASPWVTGERLGRRGVCGVLLATVGAAVIGLSAEAGEGRSDLLGGALAMLGSVSLAGYLMIGRRVKDRLSLGVYLTGVYGAAAVTLVILAVATSQPAWGYGTRSWMAIWGLTVVCHLIGHSSTNAALRFLTAATVSVVLLLEPVFASALAYAVLGEAVGRTQLIGAAVVLVGVAAVVVPSRRRRIPPTPRASAA